MSRALQFLQAVMPRKAPGQTAYYNLHWAKPGLNGKKYWSGRAMSNIPDILRTMPMAMRENAADVYICMSLQGQCESKVSRTGRTYLNAVRSSEGAVALGGLFIDIDVKEKGYASTAQALEALKSFMAKNSIPNPSAVVLTGSGGVHVHWAFEEVLTRLEWQPLANAFVAMIQAHGLIVDTACTIDAARILRVPDTFNYKTNPPGRVDLLSVGPRLPVEVMRELLKPFMVAGPGMVAIGGKSIPDNDDLGAGLSTNRMAADITIEDVAKGCPFIRRTLGTGGKDNDQPLWFMTAQIAANVDEGRAALHAMSKQHPGYVPKETDELYDRTLRNKSQKDLGWPQCAKIAQYGAPECKSCPLLAAAKSPLNYVVAQLADKTDDTLPEKYLRNQDGMLFFRHIDEDGVQTLIPIFGYPIYSAWLSNNPWTFHFVTRSENGKRITAEIPTEVIFAKDGFSKYMGGRGFFCTDGQYKTLKEFLVAWLQKLQMSKDSVISAAPFGWSVVDGTIEGFAYSGRVWMDGDDRPAANPNPVLAYQFTPKGDLDPWKDLAEIIYSQNRPALDAILAVAFAAPLVRFTGFPGLLLNAYSSESGIGKTTAMRVSQAVWGHPVLAMQGLNDTTNSVLGKMGQIRSLPMYWDELKSDQQTKRFVSIVFDLTGGREKTRMNSDATLRMSGTWQTMLVSASNDSIVDAMAREVGSTTAGLHRMFEYIVDKPASVSHDVGAVQRLAGRLEDNYGQAGLAYARFLGSNWKRIQDEVASCQDQVCRDYDIKQEERFWAATIAVILKGAEYANELSLTQINLARLSGFLGDVLARMRGEVDQSPADMSNNMSISAILAEFFNSTRARNTLVTNRIWVARGKPPNGTISILCDVSKLGEIMVHMGREDKLVRISSIYLTRWMADRGYSRHTLVKRLESEFGLTKLNGKLGGGTDLTCATEHLLELDGNDPRLAAFLDI